MSSLDAKDIKPFMGSKDFEISRDFYTALGWDVNFDQGDFAELELGNCRFYLQKYYQREWCENSMLHITVDDAHAWYEHANAVIESGEYAAARTREPKEKSYGAIVNYVWDPVGVLLHFAQPIET